MPAGPPFRAAQTTSDSRRARQPVSLPPHDSPTVHSTKAHVGHARQSKPRVQRKNVRSPTQLFSGSRFGPSYRGENWLNGACRSTFRRHVHCSRQLRHERAVPKRACQMGERHDSPPVLLARPRLRVNGGEKMTMDEVVIHCEDVWFWRFASALARSERTQPWRVWTSDGARWLVPMRTKLRGDACHRDPLFRLYYRRVVDRQARSLGFLPGSLRRAAKYRAAFPRAQRQPSHRQQHRFAQQLSRRG